jgi:hypothetical protein
VQPREPVCKYVRARPGPVWPGLFSGIQVNGADTRLVVIGGSAGALEPRLTILAQLPAELRAEVFVALHRSAHESALRRVLIGTSDGGNGLPGSARPTPNGGVDCGTGGDSATLGKIVTKSQ